MKRYAMSLLAALSILLVACATTEVAQQPAETWTEDLQRPARVVVGDFVGDRAELPADSAIAAYLEQRTTPPTQQEIEMGRRLGERVEQQLVMELNNAGIQAQRAASAGEIRPGDGVIRGEFIVIDEGSRTKRMLLGFGAGAGELKTLVETYQMTPTGLRPLGAAQVQTAGGKLPGVLVPLGIGASVAGVVAGGTSNVMQERGPESINAAAQRTAKEIARQLADAYRKRGWL